MPALMAVFFIIFYLVYEDIKDRTAGEFNNEQMILARTAAEGMASFFEEHQAFLSFLSENKEIVDFTEKGEEILSGFYGTHKNIIEAVTRVDADGIIRFTCPENQTVIGSDISYQQHVREIIATQKPVVSDVFLSAQGYLAIALHVPIFRDGAFAGSLAILIPIDKLGRRYLGNIKSRGTGKVWLMSENGVEIYCPIPGHMGKTMIENSGADDSVRELNDIIKEQSSGTIKVFIVRL